MDTLTNLGMVMMETFANLVASALSMFTANPLVASLINTITSPRFQRSVIQAILFTVLFLGLLSVATVLYSAFYYLYIPNVEYSQPLYLQYGTVEERLKQPTATIPLIRPTEKATLRRRFPLNLFLPARVEYPFTPLEDSHQRAPTAAILTPGQRYDFVVGLKAPESDHNFSLGNFMITCQLTSNNGTHPVLVARGSRPGLLTHKTWIIRWISSLWRAAPLAFGWWREQQSMDIPCLEAIMEHASHPSTHLTVTLSTPHLHTYSTDVKIHAHFTGLRYFMYHWPVSTAVLGISSLMFWICLSVFVAWRVLLKGVTPPEEEPLDMDLTDPALAWKQRAKQVTSSEGEDVAVVGVDAMGRKILVRRRKKQDTDSDLSDSGETSGKEEVKSEFIKQEPME